jgi:hypothetical protein
MKAATASGDELDGDRGQQQAGDAGEHLDAGRPQDAHDQTGEPQDQPDRQQHQRDTERDRAVAARPVGPLHEQHGGHDRARPGQQGRADRHQGDVGGGGPVRVVGRAGEQLQGHQQQQDPAGRLQGRQLNAQVPQDLLAADGEDHDHSAGQCHRLPGRPAPFPGRHRARQREEDRHHAGRVGDHEERDEHFAEQPHVHRHIFSRRS